MARGALLSEDGGRRIYLSDDPAKYIIEFLGGETEYDGDSIPARQSKPAYNLKIAAAIFKLLESNGLATHFIREAGEREMETRRVKTFPVAVICRNVSAGGFSARTGLPEGEMLPSPVVEFAVRKSAVPGGGRSGIEIFTEITDGHVKVMFSKTYTINKILKTFLYERGLALADFKLEFGMEAHGAILVCGGLHPDTCRIWDRDLLEKIDKDRFRHALRGDDIAYMKVLTAISGN
jgi:phosphoribosylaminoimidazole-succinocarboxamide synthase